MKHGVLCHRNLVHEYYEKGCELGDRQSLLAWESCSDEHVCQRESKKMVEKLGNRRI